jgi:putative transposase
MQEWAFMREPRIKVDPETGEAIYHCMSHVVSDELVLDNLAKEVLRRQIWQVSDYCGVEIRTHSVLSNHFHVTVCVPRKVPVADEELLRRYQLLYSNPGCDHPERLEAIRKLLKANGVEAQHWRKQQLALMGDLSAFMKLLKQRFSIWYNRKHKRIGTLWRERFKSLLVEPAKRALSTLAAYIDLNAVRAGLVVDPKDYPFCGYAEAVGGNEKAQRGLMNVLGMTNWEEAHAAYRQMLFGTGAEPRQNAAVITADALARVFAEGGKLPLATVLRCRMRYFSDGAVLGERGFVQAQFAEHCLRTGRRRHSEPHPVPSFADWGELATLRGLRRQALG